jgi:hypothetical protein
MPSLLLQSVTCWPSVHRVAVGLVNIEFLRHCLLCMSGCVVMCIFIFFEAFGNFLKTILSALAKQALLQFWSVRWLVRIANVLAFRVGLFHLFSFVIPKFFLLVGQTLTVLRKS